MIQTIFFIYYPGKLAKYYEMKILTSFLTQFCKDSKVSLQNLAKLTLSCDIVKYLTGHLAGSLLPEYLLYQHGLEVDQDLRQRLRLRICHL